MTQPARTLKWTACWLLIILSGCQWFSGSEEVVLPDRPILILGGYGEGSGQFQQLATAAIDQQGSIVVADNRLRRMTWFGHDGQVSSTRYYDSTEGTPIAPGVELQTVRTLTTSRGRLYIGGVSSVWEIEGQDARQIPLPDLEGTLRDLVVDQQGRILALTDSAVSVYDSRGQSVEVWSFPGDPSPRSRSMSLGPEGRLYVAARSWGQVVVFDEQGNLLNQVAISEEGQLRSVAVDAVGRIYVTEQDDILKLLDSEGATITQGGGRGSAPGQTLWCPQILLDQEHQRLVQVDPSNYRIQVYDLTGRETETLDRVVSDIRFPATTKPDHVVLTLGDNPDRERRITWRTDVATVGSEAMVLEINSADEPSEVDWNSSAVLKVSGNSVEYYGNLGSFRAHELELNDLESGVQYAYRVGDGSDQGWSETRFIRMAPHPEKQLRVVALGDSRNRMDVWSHIVNSSAEQEPAFIINTGDLVANGYDMMDWDSWFEEARLVFDRIPLMPCLGNHERQSPIYFLSFALPTNGPDELKEQCYSFDYGPVHWVVLNTEVDLEAQSEWLAEDLANSSKPWIFAFFHRPAYAGHPSRGDGNMDVRDAWSGLFEREGVDIAWQGHDHYYFRTKPIRGGEVVEPGSGPIYVTTGGAGAPLYPIKENQYAEVAESVDHYCVITVTPRRCEISVFRADGSVLDRFSLQPRGRLKDETGQVTN